MLCVEVCVVLRLGDPILIGRGTASTAEDAVETLTPAARVVVRPGGGSAPCAAPLE